MNHSIGQPKFEIQPTIEQRPFVNPAVQAFFTKWCEINDSIKPQVISRDDWEQRGVKGILEKAPDGKQALYIPEDLQLWEMVGIMEVVDHDTFAAKPERADQAKEKILELGQTFQNTGIYIAQRLDFIKEGREMAGPLAEEFYGYGKSLASGEKLEEPQTTDDIAFHTLTVSEIATIDRFLAGDSLYESRRARVEKATVAKPNSEDDIYETERRKTLAQFFRASAKAFELKKKSERGELREDNTHLQPWQNDAPLHSAFIAKIEKRIIQKIETPKREFDAAIFRRGLEKLVGEIKERGWKHNLNSFFKKLGIDLRLEQKKLADALNIKRLKAELETIRQSGDVAKISIKEREIADKIQKAVSGFPYSENANNPSEMVANQYINCVGASILGGVLMREAGLNYFLSHVPGHAVLFLVTSDNHVEWRDMLSVSDNENLTDEMIEGHNEDGSSLTIKDIVSFSKNPIPAGLMFDIKDEKYRSKLKWFEGGNRKFVIVFEPEYGQQIQILNNMGCTLSELGRNEEAIEAYRQAIIFYPKFAYAYNGLGNALSELGRNEEAIEAYRQAIAVDPKYADSYYNLGNIISDLGRKEEAIEAYRKFIELAEKQDDYWIKQAENMIVELQEQKASPLV